MQANLPTRINKQLRKMNMPIYIFGIIVCNSNSIYNIHTYKTCAR